MWRRAFRAAVSSDDVALEARRAAEGLRDRHGRDAALVALHNRQKARAEGDDAGAAAWQRVFDAALQLEERAAALAWAAGDPARGGAPAIARILAPRGPKD